MWTLRLKPRLLTPFVSGSRRFKVDLPNRNDRIRTLQKDLENIEIKSLTDIVEQSTERVDKNFQVPSDLFTRYIKHEGDISKEQWRHVRLADYLYSDISAGDVVHYNLSDDLSTSAEAELAVIVKVPQDIVDTRYTIVTVTGRIEHIRKGHIQLRFPRLFTSSVFLENVIARKPELTDPKNQFMVPESARKLIHHRLSRIMGEAWNMLPDILGKLKYTNKLLQLNRVKSVSIYELASICSIEFPKFPAADVEALLQMYQKLSSKTGMLLQSDFGRPYPTPGLVRLLSVPHIYGLFLGIVHQSNLWNYNTRCADKRIRSPVYIEVKSISDSSDLTDQDLDEVIGYIDIKLSSTSFPGAPPKHYHSVISLVKDYCSGGINDNVTESFIVNFLRRLQVFQDFDTVNQTLGFHLLQKLQVHLPDDLYFQDPCVWDKSTEKSLDSEYYQLVTKENLWLQDPLEGDRVDFGALPVYCIDAEDAHEIDDGVSISKVSDSKWIVYIHIADPASYIDPDSDVAKVALQRASTGYFPEIVVPMLPAVVAEIAGLGVDGRATRTITYSVAYNPQTETVDWDSAAVTGGIVRNFPKLTYNSVDDILANKPASLHHDNLLSLLQVSELLRRARLSKGAYKVSHEKSSVRLSSQGEISLTTQKQTQSTVLVSELMILANSVAGNFFEYHKIPAVYRALSSPVGYAESDLQSPTSVRSALQSHHISSDSFYRLLLVMPAAYFSPVPAHHFFLAIENYTPSTSPLRRFCDLISHWQTHSFITKSKYRFSRSDIQALVPHLQYRTSSLQDISSKANTYWKIRHLIQTLNGNSDFMEINYSSKNNAFKFLVTESADSVSQGLGFLLDYQIRAHIKSNGSWSVGETITAKIANIDLVAGVVDVC